MDQLLLPRRVRHITSVRICNITPFPVRDEATSALARPAEQSQFTSHGHLSDDTDVALARRRGRRISSASVSTLKSLRDVEEQDGEGDTSSPTRSKVQLGHDSKLQTERQRTSSDASKAASASSASRKPTIRRKRADSTTSRRMGTSLSGVAWAPTVAHTASTLSRMLPDHSQGTLDRILRSRLTETFIAISVPAGQPQDLATPHPPPTPTSPQNPRFPSVNGTSRFARHRPTMSTPVATHPPQSPLAPSTSSTTHLNAGNGSLSTTTPSNEVHPDGGFTLAYLSAIHRPSTNPLFDVNTEEVVASENNSATRVKIEVYGKQDPAYRSQMAMSDNGKGKQKAADESPANQGAQWRVLESWIFDLSKLVPLPKELAESPTRLPSNSLVVTLEPFGTAFYLPSSPRVSNMSRSPSPSGYNSDPESNAENVRRARASSSASNELFLPRHGGADHAPPLESADSTMSVFSDVSIRRRNRPSKTVGFPDLVKLVTLQTVVKDTQHSLDEVVSSIECNILSDGTAATSRALGEREAYVNRLRGNIEVVEGERDRLRQQIARRRAELSERRDMLKYARELETEEASAQLEQQQALSQERDTLTALRQRIAPLRTDLITTMASIFPIELVAPADLLFSIVDVPLPIPVAASDPAPPLSLPSHRDVNEETIASSLGFAAQVVVMLAAYLGHRLVYPITCIGSRSLIKDEISAMVGPRMFPLYSKGVDTYRFEYGVFLLNKNIEMLMAERNLRALDIRHTLPNLKNLLLTLTDGGVIRSAPPPRPSSAASTIDTLATSTPRATTPTPSADIDAETAISETATPTSVETPMPKKPSKGYFGLSSFLRSRYPSVKPSVKSVPEAAEDSSSGSSSNIAASSQASSDAAGDPPSEDGVDDEEDRRTIRAAHSAEPSDATEPESEEEGKQEMSNGHANVVLVADRSKEHKLVVAVPPSSPAPPVVS